MKEDDEAIVIDSPSPEAPNDNDAASSTSHITRPETEKKPNISPHKAPKKKKKHKKKSNQFEETEDSLEGKKMLSKLTKRHKAHKKSSRRGHSSNGHSGPYVEVNGQKDYPMSCKIVNLFSSMGEVEGGERKRKSKKNELSVDVAQPKSLVMDNSEPWECVFCHHSRHFQGLGDLFGPYQLDGMTSPPSSPEKAPLPSPPSSHKKKVDSIHMDEKALKRQRLLTKKAGRSPDQKGMAAKNSNLPTEIWIHEDCAVWASGVYCTGAELRGLQDAVVNALQVKCSVCKMFGASLGCFHKSCQKKYHYLCAMDQECVLDVEKFCMTCPAHKGK